MTTSLDALLALAAAVAFGGFAPMAYVLARELRRRRARIAATQRMQSARAVAAIAAPADLDATIKALLTVSTAPHTLTRARTLLAAAAVVMACDRTSVPSLISGGVSSSGTS